MPQASLSITTPKSPVRVPQNHNAAALRNVLAKAAGGAPPPKRNLNELLAAAWKAHASNRPEYERRWEAKNERLYHALRQTKAPYTPDLKSWFAVDYLVTTEQDEIVATLDEQTAGVVGDLQAEIIAKQCENIGDLAALANACAIANADFWDEPLADLDWDKKLVRHLVEAVLAVAEEQNVLTGLPIPQTIAQNAMERVAKEREQSQNIL